MGNFLTVEHSGRVAILTGEGRAFCSGGNLKGMKDRQGIGPLDQPELFLTGDTFDAAAALAMGLVSRVVPADGLMDAALELAGRIAANPPRALRLTKRLLREAQNSRMSDVLELSAAFQAIAHETADHKEAVAAFLEKRPPQFTGQ